MGLLKIDSKIEWSIILSVYKEENYMKECLRSIISPLNNRVELIIVDDGSPEDSMDICEQMPKILFDNQHVGRFHVDFGTGIFDKPFS